MFTLFSELLKNRGEHIAVLEPTGVERATYEFEASKADVIATLNEIGSALEDLGNVATLN